MNYKQELITFNNGLQLVFVAAPGLYTARVKVQFLVGSEDEKDEFGMAHLLEHELFKGTSKYSQKELSEQFSRLAAEPNASTSSEFTSYRVRFPKPALKKVINLLSDMIFDSVFDADELENEKNVIVEEIKMHQDHPSRRVFDELIAARFKNTGLGNRIAGREDLLRSVTREQLIAFKNKHYNAKNCSIIVAGDFNKKELIKLIEEYFVKPFDKFTTGEKSTKVFTPTIEPSKKVVKTQMDTQQANISMAFSAPSMEHEDHAKIFLMSHILGGTMNSRLFTKIRNELSLCYGIYSTKLNYANNGVFLIDFSTTNANATKTTQEVLALVEDMKQNGVTDEEFEEARYMTISQIKMDEDFPSTAGLNFLAYTGKLRNLPELIKQFETITKKESEECFKKYINTNNLTISFVGDTKQFKFKI